MGDRSRDASALLGMEGVVVCSQSEEDGELYVLVETTANVAGCPRCGVKATGCSWTASGHRACRTRPPLETSAGASRPTT